ncbi:hypothetical protein E2C01_076890 [Portunus trituberculatus]|uniref:Uncharacterized protein n=1 Tax=Portunus trituberculatus TaxID=210409 RepID=A0A5B7IKU1_PORTR|nr:hypothetical protein [Portunus trituberculatus]
MVLKGLNYIKEHHDDAMNDSVLMGDKKMNNEHRTRKKSKTVYTVQESKKTTQARQRQHRSGSDNTGPAAATQAQQRQHRSGSTSQGNTKEEQQGAFQFEVNEKLHTKT